MQKLCWLVITGIFLVTGCYTECVKPKRLAEKDKLITGINSYNEMNDLIIEHFFEYDADTVHPARMIIHYADGYSQENIYENGLIKTERIVVENKLYSLREFVWHDDSVSEYFQIQATDSSHRMIHKLVENKLMESVCVTRSGLKKWVYHWEWGDILKISTINENQFSQHNWYEYDQGFNPEMLFYQLNPLMCSVHNLIGIKGDTISETLYEYNKNGYPSRREHYTNGILVSYSIFTYGL